MAVGRRAAAIITTTSGAPSNRGPITCSRTMAHTRLGRRLYVLRFKYLSKHDTPDPARTGIEIQPRLLADYNTGIYETSIYGNIDSKIYPTLDSSNDTFNRQAGILQKYSPLPDLLFTAQGNYAHSTNATVLLNSTTPSAPSIPSPIVSPANPALPGAAGVVANAQTVVDPNDTYTASANVYKEFNRAYAVFGGSIYRHDL